MLQAGAGAADRIDELLVAFVQYGTATWPDEFTKLLASAGGRTVRVATTPWSWLLSLGTKYARCSGPRWTVLMRPCAVYRGEPAAVNPAMVTLTRQSLAVVSASYDALFDGMVLPLAKYRPLTPSTSGEEAR